MLSEEFKGFLYGIGAKLVGFADMSGVEECGYPRAVSVALPVPPHILREIADGPTKSYYYMYHELNNGLNRIVTSGAEYLRERGYSAQPQTTDAVSYDADCRSALPHKTVAVRSGLGWIGKSCLLVTPEYGSAVRISSLLTDAPLACASSVMEPLCGGCDLCRSSCPGQALSGLLWNSAVDRDLIVDTGRCTRKQRELMMARTGIEADICGKCFVVCPYTAKYLSAAAK